MKALIIDDERLARQELKRLLKAHAEIEVVGEAANAGEAAGQIESLSPDVIFLDIQMPGKDGFQLLESLESVPAVIFTTAFDEYAIKAFEFNALDYLLKPVEPGRLATAVEKLRKAERDDSPSKQKLSKTDQVFVRDGERCWFIKLQTIRLLESEGNYTRVYFETEKPLISRSLRHLEGRLDSKIFFRANRKHIINLNWIEKVAESPSGGLLITLHGAPVVDMSKRQARIFRERMSL